MSAPRDLVFILGTQRSGTTWLANIFDSHPDCLHFYEPFAPAYGLFPYMPREFVFVEPPADVLATRLRSDFAHLVDHRSRLFDPVHATRRQFLFEAWLMGKLETLNRRVQWRHLDFAAQFNLLHLNRLGQSPPAYFAKSAAPSVTAVKEVRVYFKVLFLAATFPQAKFIHVVRHPAAVVSSMDTFLKRGRLVEINANIRRFADTVGAQQRFNAYAPLLAGVRGAALEDQLAAYWRIANESIVEQFRAIEGRTFSLVYEDLATDPLARVRDLFAWCGLSMPASTDAYVRESSTSRSDRKTALDTNRVSATYYRDWVGKASPAVLAAVERVCADSPLMDRFAPFYARA